MCEFYFIFLAGLEFATVTHLQFFANDLTNCVANLQENVRRISKLQCVLELVAFVMQKLDGAPSIFAGQLARLQLAF